MGRIIIVILTWVAFMGGFFEPKLRVPGEVLAAVVLTLLMLEEIEEYIKSRRK